MNDTIKVMSFNLRTPCKDDGINYFWNRTDRVLNVINGEQPDVIGFQEATSEMRTWLADSLTGYTVLGCGREKQYDGESPCVAYKHSKFELISMENFWLSPTPDICGSRYPDSQSLCPRSTVALKLFSKSCQKPFMFYNTHLDHMGELARYLGMMQNIQHISQSSLNFIYTGDMNALPGSDEIKLFEKSLSYRGGKDATAELGGTYHGYGKSEPMKIDYIFTDANCSSAYRVEDPGIGGAYYSDHNAVCAEITL